MKLEYINEHETSIKVTLEEGESLGNLTGPVTSFVPTDPANTDYAEIKKGIDEGAITVDPYRPPAKAP